MRSNLGGAGLELADMVTVSEIREKLIDLLASEVDKESALSSFEDWLVQASWNMHQTSELRAQQFASEIELVLAEDESDAALVWGKLKEILRSYSLSLSSVPVLIESGSSATFRNQEWAFSPVGKQRVVAYG